MINDVSFKITRGKFHTFIGSNGAGKTTTIKCLINAFNFWDGEITIEGESNKLASAKQHLGYMPENVVFPSFFNLEQLLDSLLLVAGVNHIKRKQQIKKVLYFLDLEEFKNRNPNLLSSGQKRKVMLAQALINNPKILVIDEPTAHLSPIARRELFEILLKLKEAGVTIFISTHDLFEVSRYTDELTIIDRGKILYSGPKYLENLEDIFFQFVNIKDYKVDDSQRSQKENDSKQKRVWVVD